MFDIEMFFKIQSLYCRYFCHKKVFLKNIKNELEHVSSEKRLFGWTIIIIYTFLCYMMYDLLIPAAIHGGEHAVKESDLICFLQKDTYEHWTVILVFAVGVLLLKFQLSDLRKEWKSYISMKKMFMSGAFFLYIGTIFFMVDYFIPAFFYGMDYARKNSYFMILLDKLM